MRLRRIAEILVLVLNQCYLSPQLYVAQLIYMYLQLVGACQQLVLDN